MEGTYGNAFRSNIQSPMSPNTPSGGQYKTNVNRTKTKKWVEAKVQNYDGDDWGADEYGDEPEEDVPPPPPPKPLGPRLPGSNPSSQPPTPQSAVHSGKPFSASGSPAPSPGLRGSSGPPALQIQTQQPPAAAAPPGNSRPDDAGPSNAPVAAPSGAPAEQVTLPQSAGVPQSGATASSVYSQPSARNVSSPVTERRMSPAPQPAAGAVPTRFPPRKSSMGQQGAPDLSEIIRPTSRPDSAQGKPWMEGRPASPLGPRSPGGQPPNKPNFIRPADIYRRMEEEKERERLSMDSNRPSLDSLGARGSERSSSPLKTDSEQRRGSFGGEDGADRTRTSNQGLTPVAERKSEYGFDGMLAGSQQQPGLAGEPKPAIGADEDGDLRRFSTSPKLPDLARMSLFGEDLFSNSATFLAGAPPMPTIPDRETESSEEETPNVSAKPVVLPTQAHSDTSSEASQKDELKPVETQSSEARSIGSGKASDKKTVDKGKITEEAAAVSAAEALAPPRPSLPGGWVTETGATPNETPGETSKELSGINAPGSAPSTEETRVPDTIQPQMQAGDIGTDESSDDDDDVTSSRAPGTLPPIDTSSKPAPMVEDKAMMPPPVPADSTKPQAPDATPTTATSDVPPTAPLNPRRSEIFPSDFVPPQSLERISTMSTTTNSPVKESDKLREEIIRTLSPVKASHEFPEPGSVDAAQGSRNNTRESTYLNDVYGDYWSAEDKPEDEAGEGTTLEKVDEDEQEPESEKDSEPVPVHAPVSVPIVQEAAPVVLAPPEPKPEAAPNPVLNPPVLSPPALNPQREQPTQSQLQKPPMGRQRFSWEMDPEETAASRQPAPAPPVQQAPEEHEPKSLGMGIASRTPPAASPTELETSQARSAPNPDDLSPKVSLLSSAAPGSGIVAPDQLSPVSAMTEQKSPPLAPEPHRLSLADEKAQIQGSSSLVSPTPPPYEHPALAKEASTPQSPSSPVTALPPTDLDNIANFRQILSYPTAAERIAKFEETRRLFAAANSGLADWLGGMRGQPEHGAATASMRDAMVAGLVSPTGAPEQPYYQQYLNASSPTTTTGPGPRPATAGHHMNTTSQFGSSSEFRHSSGQAAAKSKEFLQSAGKMSKGLFNKSKKKLRAL